MTYTIAQLQTQLNIATGMRDADLRRLDLLHTMPEDVRKNFLFRLNDNIAGYNKRIESLAGQIADAAL